MAELERVLIESHEPKPRAGSPQPARAEMHPLLGLQRTAGNAAVSSLFVQREGDNVPTDTGGGGGGGGGGMVTVSSANIRKPATITVSLSGNSVTDATAQIG